MVKALSLVVALLLWGCSFEMPGSESAAAACQRYQDAQWRYLARCGLTCGPRIKCDPTDCKTVIISLLDQEGVDECVAEIDGAACGLPKTPDPCANRFIVGP